MQFDVHVNLGRNRKSNPYLLVVQSDRFERLPNRVVVPLVPLGDVQYVDLDLNPTFVISGGVYVMDPLQIVSIRTDFLGPLAANVSQEYLRVATAMDTLIATGK